MSLEYMVTVEESLLSLGLQPDLVLAIFGEEVETCDVKLELLCLCEFTKHGSR